MLHCFGDTPVFNAPLLLLKSSEVCLAPYAIDRIYNELISNRRAFNCSTNAEREARLTIKSGCHQLNRNIRNSKTLPELSILWQTNSELLDAKDIPHTHPTSQVDHLTAAIIFVVAIVQYASTSIGRHNRCEKNNNGGDGETHYFLYWICKGELE